MAFHRTFVEKYANRFWQTKQIKMLSTKERVIYIQGLKANYSTRRLGTFTPIWLPHIPDSNTCCYKNRNYMNAIKYIWIAVKMILMTLHEVLDPSLCVNYKKSNRPYSVYVLHDLTHVSDIRDSVSIPRGYIPQVTSFACTPPRSV